MSGTYVTVRTSTGEYLIRLDVKYTESDEWVMVRNNTAIIGITDYAQKRLRNVVNVELPTIGKYVKRGESVAIIESIKAVADVYSPLSGRILEVNNELLTHPEYINEDPYGKGWIIKLEISNVDEVNELLSHEKYVEKLRSSE